MELVRFMSGSNQQALAKALKLSQGMISHWITGRRQVGAEWVLPICEFSDWLVTPHEIRPDLYPNPTDALPKRRR